MKTENFEPKIIAFLCNWCTYGAADLAGVSRLQYPPNVRAVRVMCSATVSPHHILRALQDGADGVLQAGQKRALVHQMVRSKNVCNIAVGERGKHGY